MMQRQGEGASLLQASERWMFTYRIISICMAVVFAVVGVLFLVAGDGVLALFNALSQSVGLEQSPTDSVDFYLALAGGYMYVVALLAVLMARHPTSRSFPLVLTNAKFATTLFSGLFFVVHHHYLIYLTNAAVDGMIGFLVLMMYRTQRRRAR